MNLRELRYLVAVADHRHFGQAAEACHVTQPTLSAQIKKLEEFLGVTVFERTNKSVEVTSQGAQIVAKARTIVEAADELIDVARQGTPPLTGAFHLGIIPTLSPYAVPWLIPALQKKYPQLNLSIHEDLTDNLIERLKDHELDAAFLALPIDDSEFAELPLLDEPFLFACAPDHPRAKAKTIAAKHLRNEPLLLLAEGHCLRDQALEVCGTQPSPRETGADFTATSLETIGQMVIAGLGTTLLPSMAAQHYQKRLSILPLAGREARRLGLIYRKSFPKVADVRLLGDVIRAKAPNSVHRL